MGIEDRALGGELREIGENLGKIRGFLKGIRARAREREETKATVLFLSLFYPLSFAA